MVAHAHYSLAVQLCALVHLWCLLLYVEPLGTTAAR
jgi:hypothetical protein